MITLKRAILPALFLGSLFLSTSAFAACSTIICEGTIERLYTDSAGVLYIATDGDESQLNCTSPLNVYVTMDPSDPNFDRKYAMMLTSMSMGYPVGLRIIDNDPNCAVSYIYTDNVTTP